MSNSCFNLFALVYSISLEKEMVPRMDGPLGIQDGSKARNLRHPSNMGNLVNQFMYLDSNH